MGYSKSHVCIINQASLVDWLNQRKSKEGRGSPVGQTSTNKGQDRCVSRVLTCWHVASVGLPLLSVRIPRLASGGFEMHVSSLRSPRIADTNFQCH